MTEAVMHTRALLSEDVSPWEVFRAACAVTDPHWTQCGSCPDLWHAPLDAAGGLVLWDEDGSVCRVEPQVGSREDEEDLADRSWNALIQAGAVIGIVRAAYFSSGGRAVALCQSGQRWWVTVSRQEDVPRCGSTEVCLRAADPQARVYLCECVIKADAAQVQVVS
jgi:hypothetical protein